MITSNGVAVPFDPERTAPLTDSTGLLTDPAALRRRLATDGFLPAGRSDDGRRLVTHPALAHLADAALDGPTDLLPGQIVRQFDRASRRALRAHVHQTHLDGGTGEVVTLWVLRGDCPVETGPVVYLDSSLNEDELQARCEVSRRPDDRPDPRWLAPWAGDDGN